MFRLYETAITRLQFSEIWYVQGVSGGILNILGSGSMDYSE